MNFLPLFRTEIMWNKKFFINFGLEKVEKLREPMIKTFSCFKILYLLLILTWVAKLERLSSETNSGGGSFTVDRTPSFSRLMTAWVKARLTWTSGLTYVVRTTRNWLIEWVIVTIFELVIIVWRVDVVVRVRWRVLRSGV